ncbi:SDR family NAD(P)-dependent oxidoreductase [Acuticoccus sp. I52.16.1]|uniref:type I polyketide synthase n=1 Tax=Acuticoccus sp. I52.16.1 TaxID=2928472 RepID=UPI001FD429CA|nr:SDR family NAD(P)-dependent oxidoreductase [Acuticoccus sp. I52.16.1]UOM34325.1 SDR family NAD(P)-dependent oxidoreductase [Acuticoccus sp. I52.16.1]
MPSADRPPSPYGVEATSREPIAVVGIGCRFPAGGPAGSATEGADAYWRFLMAGGDGIAPDPQGRGDLGALYDPQPGRPGKLYTRHLGALGEVDAFDADLFGIGRRDAAASDPQQRLLLEVAWEALENAAIAPAAIAGRDVGTFVGAFSDDYAQSRLYDRDVDAIDGHTSLSVLRGLLAGRIAYHFDLHGPAMTVDTACSSALLAIHLACRALWAGECEAALAGGVNLALSPEVTVSLCQLRALSPSGACHAFAAAADGYVRGEGAGVVVLKRLSDARADGDRIIALVRGSAVNHDGRSNGLSAPNPAAQEAVIRAALTDAGVAPGEIDYVEAHGTGTALGDPIEIRALAAALGEGRSVPLKVGTVKSNIGHLEAAAGVAGFAKLALALAHGAVPPNIRIGAPNPHVAWDRVPVRIVDTPTPLEGRAGRPPLAAVSAFGMSGTNVHMVLEAPPATAEAPGSQPATARSRPQARHGIGAGAAAAPSPPPATADPATTDQQTADRETADLTAPGFAGGADAVGRPHPVVLSARSTAGVTRLVAAYRAMLARPGAPELADIAWSAGAGRSHHPVRLAVTARSNAELAAALAAGPRILEAPRTQPAAAFVFAGWDDRAAAAAVLAAEPLGATILGEIDAGLVPVLGRPLERVEDGAVAQVCLAVAWARYWMRAGVAPAVLIGVGLGEYAAAVVAGAMDLAAMVALLAARPAPGEAPAEGAALRPRFAEAARRGRLARPSLAVVSGFLGRAVTGELASPYFWADHAAASPGDPASAPTAMPFAQALPFGEAATRLVPETLIVPGGEGSGEAVVARLAALYRAGAAIDWASVLRRGCRVALPTYPFERIPCGLPRGRTVASVPAVREEVVDVAAASSRYVRTHLSAADGALLAAHTVRGRPTVAGAAICDILAGAGRAAGVGEALLDLRLREPVPAGPDLALQTVIAPDAGFELYAKDGDGWRLHATGRFGPRSEPPPLPGPGPGPADAGSAVAADEPVTGDAVYSALAAAGVSHGAPFRGLVEVRVAGRRAAARIALPAAASHMGLGFRVHPALLDAAFVAVDPLLPRLGAGRGWLPVGLAAYACPEPLPAELTAHVGLTALSPREAVATIHLTDAAGTVLGHVEALTLRAVALGARQAGKAPAAYVLDWVTREPAPAPPPSGSWAVLGEGPVAEMLRRHVSTAGAPPADAASAQRVVIVATQREADGVTRAAGVLDALKTAARRGSVPERVAIVTADAQSPRADMDVAGAALWGLARVARRELPALDIVVLDLVTPDLVSPALAGQNLAGQNLVAQDIAGPGIAGQPDAARIVAALAAAARNEEIRLGADGGVQVHRLAAARSGVAAGEVAVRLPAADTSAPGPGEVAIDVVASGLNFRDVLHHLGRLPESAARMPYGLECAGIVAEVGAGVDGLAPGDAVVAGLPVGTLSGRVVVRREFVAPKPAALSFREAATLPLAFITAHYALDVLARLAPGQRVLVHAAAGGVGQAAIQVARRAGAEVFATASPAKWEVLRRQGVGHVYNSRDDTFGEAILAATGGEGVDVVLNSLAGEIVTASIACLADGGHFIEIGKTEPWPDARIAGLPRGIRFTAFDLWDVKADRGLVAAMMGEMVARIEDGTLAPLPLEAFPIGAVTQAFAHMARARHVGKIVIDQDARALLRPGASYLVTGGLGGLGLHAAAWLAARGGETVVLLGRSAPDAAAQEAIAALRAGGTEVWGAGADVTDAAEMSGLLARLEAAGRPLAGVVHAAGVLGDAALVRQDAATLAAAMRPKLAGAELLAALTRTHPLDFMLLYGSAAAVLGNPGQANYAAANAALAAFAAARTAAGHRTLALDWGPWGEIGMAARSGVKLGDAIAAIHPDDAAAMLDEMVLRAEPEVVVLAVDWPAFAEAGPTPPPPLLADLVPPPGAAPTSTSTSVAPDAAPPLLAELQPLDPRERGRVLRGHVRRVVARELEVVPEAVDPRQELATLGFDSMMGIELQAALEAGLGVSLGLTLTFDHPTVDAITRHLLEDVLTFGAAPRPAADAAPMPPLGPAEAVSATDAALLEELATLTHLRPT